MLRRKAVWIPAAIVGVIALAYISAFAYVGSDVPRGTAVRGVDIGGMTEAAAETKLGDEFGDAAKRPVQVEVGGKRYEVDPAQVDLTFDAKATAESAGQRSANPVRLAGQIVDGSEVEPVVRVDEQKLASAVADIAKKFDQPVREGKVSYEGLEPVTTLPRAGRVVDQAAAMRKITTAYPSTAAVGLPVKEPQPKSTAADVRETAAEAAPTAVSAPVDLGTGKKTLQVSRKALAANTEFVVGDDGKLAAKVDGTGLAEDLGSSLDKLETKPKDARFKLKGDKPVVVDSVDGRMVDRKRLGDAVVEVLGKTAERSVSAPISKAKPKLTTADAKKLGIEEKVGTFTTRHSCCEGRVTNIHRAADIMDDTVVKPGKTFSLNGTLGERTRAKGFVPAPMILEGRHVDSVGGGVSQIATTTFNAMFFAGLKDVQHQPHSYWISRYPLGREATISWTQPDLRFKNDSGHGILITTSYTSTSITVTMWGTKRYDIDATSPQKSNHRNPKTIRDKSPDCSPESPSVGYDVTYSRVFKQGGKVVRTEPFRTVYLAAPKVICEKDEKKKREDEQEEASSTAGG